MNILNITNVNYEENIKLVIDEVNNEYKELIKERTCIIYSALIYDKLKKKHIITSIINTKEYGYDYEHRFNIVYDKEYEEYYIIDLTYKQFFNTIPEEFIMLYNEGYQKGNKDIINNYLESIFNKRKRVIR